MNEKLNVKRLKCKIQKQQENQKTKVMRTQL